MKLSIKQALLLSAIAMAASNSNLFVHADEVVVTEEVDDSAAEINVEEAVEVEVVADENEDVGDAKECTAEEDCSAPPVEEEEADTPAVQEEEAVVEEETEAVAEAVEEVPPKEEDPSCPSRPHIIRCAQKYLDTNQNNQLEKSELESAMNSVPWILRSLLNIIGSVDSIMVKCDADGDGAIGVVGDMQATEETCLATCFKRKAFKKLFFPDCTE